MAWAGAVGRMFAWCRATGPALLLAAGLAACTLAGGDGAPATGAATETIAVTPLDPAAPAAGARAAATGAAPVAAPSATNAAPAGVEAGVDEGPNAPEDPAGPADSDAAAADDTGAGAEDAAPADAAPLSAAASACLRRNGRWVGTGEGLMACVKRTRDAGQNCRREGDCQGYCLARSGTCAPYTPLFGCHEVLGPNGERTTICLD